MFSVRSSVKINRPAEEVFDLLKRLEDYPLWQSGMIKVVYDPPVRRGTVARGWTNNMGVEVEVGVEVTEFEAPTRLEVESRLGPLIFSVRYTLSETGASTRLTCITQIETGSIYALAEPVIEDMGQIKMDSDLRSLKSLLERED